MRTKFFILATILLITSASAFADSLGRDFWAPYQEQGFDTITPKKGTGFVSTDISLGYRKFKDGYGKARKKTVLEYMGYGLTDKWTLYAEIGRDWNRYSNDGKFSSKLDQWFLASGYRFWDDGQNIANGLISYWQKNDPIYGLLKGYSVYGLYGHSFEMFSPHAIVGWNQYMNKGKENNEEWYLYGGTSIILPMNFNLELGVEYDRQASSFKTWSGYTSISYLFKNRISTELYDIYVLDSSVKHGTPNYEIKKGNILGLRMTVAF